MAHIFSEQNALSGTAEAVFPTASTVFKYASVDSPLRVLLKNDDSSIIIYLGASGVTSATGFAVAAGAAVSLDITRYQDAADLFAVAASGTPELHVLIVGPIGA